jgi:hypothetical protein
MSEHYFNIGDGCPFCATGKLIAAPDPEFLRCNHCGNQSRKERRNNPTPNYYNKEIGGVRVDPYRLALIYGITDHALFHAWKKIMRAGNKPGNKKRKEIKEAVQALQRWLEIQDEDEKG